MNRETPVPFWSIGLGLIVPLALVLLAAMAIPAEAGHWMGIELRIWCLFGCAPITSGCLALCYRLSGRSRNRGA